MKVELAEAHVKSVEWAVSAEREETRKEVTTEVPSIDLLIVRLRESPWDTCHA